VSSADVKHCILSESAIFYFILF